FRWPKSLFPKISSPTFCGSSRNDRRRPLRRPRNSIRLSHGKLAGGLCPNDGVLQGRVRTFASEIVTMYDTRRECDRVQGESVRSISKRLGCSVDDIHDVLDRFAKVAISANLRVHTLALELERLDRLQRTFERQAEAGDIQSAMLVTKIIERRCIMLGISA